VQCQLQCQPRCQLQCIDRKVVDGVRGRFYFVETVLKEDIPGSFEQLVLLAVLRLGDNAYGMTVRRELEMRTEQPVSLGAVYTTLERLEKKGYLASRAAAGGPEREGRARRLFTVDGSGMEALRRALDVLDRMRVGVPALRPVGARR
jgi:PadR family transcriptional regulator, regulatory protein PadR